MNSVDEVRAAMMRSAATGCTNETFMHRLVLLRILFKLGVIGQNVRWNYHAGAYAFTMTSPGGSEQGY